MTSSSEITNFFKDQIIFVTGGTGIVGKPLVEKLLRQCQDVKKIYMLVRTKRGKSPQQRFQEVFENNFFHAVRSLNINIMEKVSLVAGDTYEPNLGLGSQELEILKAETTCVIHAAASVKFNQTLKEAALNVVATRDLLEIAKDMPNLKIFVHVSTAYSNCVHSHIKEEIFPPPMSFENFLTLVNVLDEETLNKITPQILGEWPNTYVYTKSISESVVGCVKSHFPVAVVRPSIVMPTAEEPLRGWYDSINGMAAISMACFAGVIRTMHCRPDYPTYMIPVDYFCNFTLAAAWKTVQENSKLAVYNFTGSKTNILTWEGISTNFYHAYSYELAPNQAIWIPDYEYIPHKRWNDIRVFFLHKIPAHIMDSALYCLGKRTFAVKLYDKLEAALAATAYFRTNQWHFDDDNGRKLWEDMEETDKELFKFSMDDLDWRQYQRELLVGCKKYFLNETIDCNFRKKAKMTTFLVMNYIIKALFWYMVYKMVMLLFNLVW